jgi:hypothetical protein
MSARDFINETLLPKLERELAEEARGNKHYLAGFEGGATFRAGKLANSGCPGKSYFVPFRHAVVTICNYAPVGGLAQFYFGLGQHFAGYAIEIFKQIKASDLQSPDGFGEFAWK